MFNRGRYEVMALWSGRFEGSVDTFTQVFGASLPIDKKMYAQDIAGSRAHAAMLQACGIITEEDARILDEGLASILQDIENGTFVFDVNDEDIHMAIERELTRRVGAAGARLHTGRSRNDQVITDLRLTLKELIGDLQAQNRELRQVLLQKAHAYESVIMPGFTHMQHAQPVLFAHHMLAYFWMFTRDFERLEYAYKAADASPLGSAALAGTTYPIDRQMTANTLGFATVIPNSLDAVSDRDFVCDALYACSVSMMHLSRLAEELIIWSTSEFGYITMSDSYSTGSSIMPQKKNPDFAELVRGKCGRVIGDLISLLVTMKGLPLAYNKDMQEDKEGVFDAISTLSDCMRCMAGMIETLTVHEQALTEAARYGHLAATDVADYLAKKGMPFRQAHEIVGALVLLCDKRGCNLEDLSLQDFKAASDLFEKDILQSLDLASCVAARTTEGATSPKSVAIQFDQAIAALAHDEGVQHGVKVAAYDERVV